MPPYDFNEFTTVTTGSEYGLGMYGDGVYGGVVVTIGDETYSPAAWPEDPAEPPAVWTEDPQTPAPGTDWAEIQE